MSWRSVVEHQLVYVSQCSALSRILLNVGGNDITEFLCILLERIGFPYRDLDLARSYDWNVMEDLKSRITSLLEVRGPVRSRPASGVSAKVGSLLIDDKKNNTAFPP